MKGYTALDGHYVDSEKQRVSDEVHDSQYDGSDDSFTSSRIPLDEQSTQKTTLRRPSSATARKTGVVFSYALPRRRFTRYFTLIITAILIIFIVSLTRASWAESARLAAGEYVRPSTGPPPWESFPFLKRYYGGIRTLTPRANNKPEYPDPDNNAVGKLLADALQEQQNQNIGKGFQKRDLSASTKYNPYPDYASEAYMKDYEPKVMCFLDKQGKTSVPQLQSYAGLPRGFPEPVMGSYELIGLDHDVCFERFGRLGPYGYGYSRNYGGSGAGMTGDLEGAEAVWGGSLEIDYRTVKWGEAQDICTEKNSARFKSAPITRDHVYRTMAADGVGKESSNPEPATSMPKLSKSGKKLLPRTAVIIRTWWDYNYDMEDIFYLRALINELSIQSGGEYTVHFLIHVKDDNMQIWSDDETYQRVLDNALPAEFHGMGTLWSERQMGLIYGGLSETNYRDLPVHGAYRSTYMPVQYFAHMHPEYDFFWHWEMDVRYTGHFYHFFDKVSKWAKSQPRKGLWERNARFYIPSEHGSWEDFKQLVRGQSENGASIAPGAVFDAVRQPEDPIWGPHGPSGPEDKLESIMDIKPDTAYSEDNYEWGVGEEADFITFNPLFDPSGTNWILAEDVTGYDTSKGFPPRRTAIITASRLSHRLLETMHRETALQRHTMFSEMWPGSCALHHGFKAVYAPHPVYIDRRWPTSYLAAIFNNGRNGASGGSRTSVFSDERQHNFLGTSWYYHAGFPANLWKRWFGYKVDGGGGEVSEVAGEGRMCLPGMLLHPVKQIDLIYEHQVGQ